MIMRKNYYKYLVTGNYTNKVILYNLDCMTIIIWIFENISGFDKIIVQLSVSANENEITPLKELDERQKEAETKQNL